MMQWKLRHAKTSLPSALPEILARDARTYRSSQHSQEYLWQGSTVSMALSDHSELIATVTELKVLLDTLAGIDPDTLCLPPRDTGVHPSDIFNADAATAAGFTSEAVLVLSAIPYFTCGARFGHSVTEKIYIGSGCDQNSFKGCREVFGRDVMMPPEVVPLTDSDGGYGIIYIYDTKKSKMMVFVVASRVP